MSRRGENIRKRKDGRWEGRYIKARSHSGKAKYGSVYGKSYYEVRTKLSEAIGKLGEAMENAKEGSVFSKNDMNFEEILFLWLSNNKVKLRPQTYSKYLDDIENHIIPQIGHIKIIQLDVIVINHFLEQKYKNGRLDGKGGLSSNSIRTIIFIIQSAISLAVNEGLRKPMNGKINKPSIRRTDLTILSVHEQKTLEEFMNIQTDSTKFGILLCLHLGLRIGEICGLRWSDIDFEMGTVQIRRTIERIKNLDALDGEPKTNLMIGTPKTRSSNRKIPIPEYLMPSIKSMYKKSRSEYVIEGSTYEYIDPRTYQNRFRKYLELCKIRPVNFHVLRHTFATRCIEVGVDVKSLSEILGHASVNITLNTYVHSSMELKRTQLEMLGSIKGQ